MAGSPSHGERLDIDAPLWDLSSFSGRLRHFFWVTDPRTVFTSKEHLLQAKALVDGYRAGKEAPAVSRDELLRAKQLVESSFHPDSGDLQNVFGRMSFQVPGGMAITGALLTFYKSTAAVVFWQWVNQSFNALVNYTNRNAQSDISETQLGVAYVSATTSAVLVSISLKRFLINRAPFFQRLVPFAAVAAANAVNIPLMRQNEIRNGVTMLDEKGKKACESTVAAVKGISQVVTSRIVIAAPGMTITPFIMQAIEKWPLYMRYARFLDAPAQTLIVGCWLIVMVPVGCALFPQRCSLRMETLKRWEPVQFEAITSRYSPQSPPPFLFFNKGL